MNFLIRLLIRMGVFGAERRQVLALITELERENRALKKTFERRGIKIPPRGSPEWKRLVESLKSEQ